MSAMLVVHVTRLQHAQTHKDLLYANVTLVLLEMEQHVQVHKKIFLINKKWWVPQKLLKIIIINIINTLTWWNISNIWDINYCSPNINYSFIEIIIHMEFDTNSNLLGNIFTIKKNNKNYYWAPITDFPVNARASFFKEISELHSK